MRERGFCIVLRRKGDFVRCVSLIMLRYLLILYQISLNNHDKGLIM